VRVLFSSTSGFGHVIPMLPLAHAFREAGHDVLWATADQATPLVTAAGIEAVASGASGPEEGAIRREVRTRAESVAPADRGAFVFPLMFGAALTPPMVADLMEISRRWAPDLLVHENAELAAPLVGAACGVPSLTHAFGGAVPAGVLVESGERLAELWRAHGLEVPPYAGCFESGYLDICPTSVQAMPLGHIKNVQPLRPVADTSPTTGTTAEPLVYVTMGTVQQRPELLRDVVAGVASLPVRVLVALGPQTDPASLGEQPGHVQVEAWVDQTEVLGRSTAVVSHGGSGTFLGALARGLPQLCLPQAADQFRNADGGSRAGASLTLGPSEVTAASVRAAVEQLLSDPDLRLGAQRVAVEIAAMPAPEAVVPILVARFSLDGTH
jgi:UDP:flavonoid glycosyltransferase YjiC (YdhE family)